jgi:hypothetical protein
VEQISNPLNPEENALCVPPVLLIVFNRPEHTKRCIDAIAKVSPPKVFIASDGPRAGNSVDRIRCEQVQRVLDGISWPCEVSRLNRTQNLGCQHAVSSAIDWFFSHVDRGIILEDDCVADPSFFSFCGQMLDRYADDERIGVVTGNNFQRGIKRGEASYYFSKYPHCWGWATWRRAWQHFDFAMSESDNSDHEIISQFACAPGEPTYWSNIFNRVRNGGINTWDYRWTRAVWGRRYLTVTPQINLVANIGFDSLATHTEGSFFEKKLPAREQMLFPLVHPETFNQNEVADFFAAEEYFHVNPSLIFRSLGIANAVMSKLFRRSSTMASD